MKRELLEERKNKIEELMRSEFYVPMKAKELASFFQLTKAERSDLQKVLEELLKEGRIEQTQRGRYVACEKKQNIGIFTSHPRGFGFVTIEGEEQDIFIPEQERGKAFHQDTVKIAIRKDGKGGRRREGKILEVLSHGITEVVGTFEKNKSFGFVVPDNVKIGCDIFVAQGHTKGAVDGHKVVVKIIDYGKEG